MSDIQDLANNNTNNERPDVILNIPDVDNQITNSGSERPNIFTIFSSPSDSPLFSNLSQLRSFFDFREGHTYNFAETITDTDNAVIQNNVVPNNDQNEENHIILFISILKTVFQYIPLILILVLKVTIDSLQVILEICILHFITYGININLKNEISKTIHKSILTLIKCILTIVAVVYILVFYIENSTSLGILLFYSDTKNLTITILLNEVVLTDIILKFFTLLVKAVITIIPLNVTHTKQRNRVYAFIENFMQLYRCLAPLQIWLDFFFFAYTGWKVIFGGLFSAIYISFKGFEIVTRFKPLKGSLLTMLRNMNYGRSPSKIELDTSGNLCPICHDEYNTPIVLECKHIFCESCVSTWFSSETTCPLCRAKVAETPKWQCGSTSLFYQIY